MSVLKNTMLAVVLALASSACAAQETQEWTRLQYIEHCQESAHRFEVPTSEANSVCNCAARYVSWVATDGKTEWAEFTVVMPNELPLNAIRYCRAGYQMDPAAFIKAFGTLSVSNDESQEGN